MIETRCKHCVIFGQFGIKLKAFAPNAAMLLHKMEIKFFKTNFGENISSF